MPFFLVLELSKGTVHLILFRNERLPYSFKKEAANARSRGNVDEKSPDPISFSLFLINTRCFSTFMMMERVFFGCSPRLDSIDFKPS